MSDHYRLNLGNLDCTTHWTIAWIQERLATFEWWIHNVSTMLSWKNDTMRSKNVAGKCKLTAGAAAGAERSSAAMRSSWSGVLLKRNSVAASTLFPLRFSAARQWWLRNLAWTPFPRTMPHFQSMQHVFLRYHRNKKILYVFSVFHQEYFTARKMRWLSISPVEQAKKNAPHVFQHHNPFFKCCIVRTTAATTRPKLSRCRLALLVVHNGFALKCILFHALC